MILTELYRELGAAFASSGLEGPLVFGEGPEHPRLMLIGEAPGEQEALQGRPFVGKAGKNLNEFLETLSLNREGLFISNVVKIRPWKMSVAGRKINRPPSAVEKTFFTPWLLREIGILSPDVVVTLGNTALNVFRPELIGDVHGRPLEEKGFTLFPLYHPASVIYNPSLKSVYAGDLQRLKQYLDS